MEHVGAIVSRLCISSKFFFSVVEECKLRRVFEGFPLNANTHLIARSANQWTDFYMMGTSVIKELTNNTFKSSIRHKIAEN